MVSDSPITSFSGPHRFLSNFYPAEVGYGTDTYRTVEHAYQAAKTESTEARRDIRAQPTPGRAKRIGQRVVLRPQWELVKLEVMRGLLIQKFQDPLLRKQLLATSDRQLIEGSTWGDRYWGAVFIPDLLSPVWDGQNNLGKLLMSIREEIRNA